MEGEIRIAPYKITSVSIVSIVVLGFIVYANSLHGEFIWDDQDLVTDNLYIRDWSKITKIFTEDMGAGAARRYSFYRPLTIFTYMVDYSVWELNARGYHLTNIFLHIFAALTVFWLIGALYDDKLLSLLVALLFIVHPVHTEAVSYISGRSDPLALVFMILCFILYIKNLESRRITTYIFMILTYICALLSRENSLILPALLLIYHLAFKKKFSAYQFLPLLSFSVIYTLIKVLKASASLLRVSYLGSSFQRIPGFLIAITNYLRLMILPINLHMEYGKRLFEWTHPKAILGAIILFVLLTYSFRKRKTNGLVFFCTFWFFVALLPVSHIFYLLPFYMAEHYLYLPSIGFFLVLGKVLSYGYRISRFRIVTVALVVGLLTFNCYLTIRQNSYWTEPIAFYERTLKHAPGSFRIYTNLGKAYRTAGRDEEAMAAYKKAIEINPNDAFAYNNIGNIYHDMGRDEEAIAFYEKALEIKPNLEGVYFNLGSVYTTLGRYNEAIASYKKVLEINPNYARAYNNLSIIYLGTKQYDLAIECCDKAKELGLVNSYLLEALRPYREDELNK